MSNYTLLTMASKPNPHLLNGLSVEWDPHIFRSFNTETDNRGVAFDPATDWALVERRVARMGLQRARVWMQPEWFRPAYDRWDFSPDNVELYSLIRHLELAEKLGIRINLTMWCAQSTGWLGDPTSKDWCSAPNDPEMYAEITCRVVQELLVNRGFTCIRELTLFNEPSWAFLHNVDQVSFADYAELVRVTHRRLQELGLRNRLMLIVSDDAEHTEWYRQSVTELSSIADGYASHTYAYGPDTPDGVIEDWVTERHRISEEHGDGKPFIVDEFGTNRVIPPMTATDTYTYERGLFLAKFLIDALNCGASGASYWCLYDENYGLNNRMEVGLWGFADENYAPRPTYYAWGMLNAYTTRRSRIIPLSAEGEGVSGVALEAPNGDRVFILLNQTGEPQPFRLETPLKITRWQRALYSRDTLPNDDTLPPMSLPVETDGTTEGVLPAESFAIYRTCG